MAINAHRLSKLATVPCPTQLWATANSQAARNMTIVVTSRMALSERHPVRVDPIWLKSSMVL